MSDDYTDLVGRLRTDNAPQHVRLAAADAIEAQAAAIKEKAARIAELEAVQEANDKVVLGYCLRITKLEALAKELADELADYAPYGDDDDLVQSARAALEGK